MQLRVKHGFRAIHCRQCRLQQLCSRNNCQCCKVWRHCPIHRTDPAKHMSRKAPKRTKEEQERRRKAQAQTQAEGSGGRSSTNKKRGPPEVEEGTEAIRKRKGSRRKRPVARSYRLKPMKTLAPQARCDPIRLERIRLKEKCLKDNASKDEKMPSETPANSFPYHVELAEEYRSTLSDPTMPMTSTPCRGPSRTSFSGKCANDGKDAKVDAHRNSMQNRTQRSDFNKFIKQEIHEQASRAAKRRKVSDRSTPNPPVPRDACKNSGTESIKGKTNDKGKQSQRVTEFRSFREKSEQDAIFRLLSRDDRNTEPHTGMYLSKIFSLTEI